ncbi:glycosyltransferase [Microbacterium sp. NPDC090218]
MTRTLLLLTHQFPHEWGDTAFVRNEIDALGAHFDAVRVVSFWGDGAPTAALPANATYLGSIGRITPGRALHAALSLRRLRRMLAVTVRAISARRFQPGADLRAMLTGMAIDRRLDELGARTHASEPLTVYAFWGVDIAYALPWFATTDDAVAVRVHRYDLDDASEGYRPLRPAVLAAADLLLTISEAARRYARERHRGLADPERIEVRRLGVPGPSTPPTHPEPRPEARTVTSIVSASSVIPLKRTDLILDSVAELARRGRAVSWTHFGDGAGLEALRTRAADLCRSLPDLEVVFPGRVSVRQILEHHRDTPADVFLNLSTIEGVPVSIMEAAAYGIPAVATDVGATGEIVGHELGSGILVPVDATASEIADAVDRVLADPQDLDPHRVWAERFDARRNAEETAKAIAALRPQGSPRASRRNASPRGKTGR